MHADRANKNHSKTTHGLVLGPLLALAFLGLSFLRIVGDVGSALFGGEARIAPLEQSIWGMLLAWRLAGHAGSLVLVHVSLGVAAWGMAWLTHRAWPSSGNSQRVWTCLWMVLAVTWILGANAAWFPSSSLGNPYAGLVQASIAGVSIFDVLSFGIVIAISATVARFAWRHRRLFRLPDSAMATPMAAVLILALAASIYVPVIRAPSTAAPTKPNVILIGLDSVKADISRETTDLSVPALQAFLREAAVFPDTTTPLARTFAAWVSILTGRHPHTTGATVNLLPRDLIETGETLPELLRDAGYETVYGIDEVRFSNIDESYGFDRIVGPRIGSADFLIEFFGDTPLSNLIVNSRVGDRLFPELHGNRAAEVLYDPDTFIRDLDRGLNFDSPTFLAVHLTLAHWPYTWAASEPRSRGTVDPGRYADLYAAAIKRVDRQFADLMAMLQLKGGLDNAIVVLLSDHGESLGELSPLSNEAGHVSPLLGKAEVYGHGTHVFSDDQYKVLLAVKSYGDTPLELPPGERIDVPASLEDIAPTLLDALDLNSRDAFDGYSLMPHLGDREHRDVGKASTRIRFLETEFNPPGIAIEQPMTGSAIAKASTSYRIDPVTDRVEVRPEQLSRILASRQYAAVVDGHWMAAVPAADLDAQHIVYVDAKEGGPVWLEAPPSAESAPVQQRLWSALRSRFEPVASRPVAAVSPASR
ncbi:MAG TPA: sulfatase-like hydrolase/transferase [Gammaproteobacteria bacterium]|nr:sulfatase-like hydrolase/transferase [Gammaproteobacteria bacterium]